MSKSEIYDLVVIGGGINGTGIARDAAGRGLKVLLVEKDDIAQGTSSRSGKLIHGGLRYLEYYEFRLVREALIEREVLLRAAPHISWPMRFVLPHTPEQRPAWLVRLGLFLYDHLGGRKLLPKSRHIKLNAQNEGHALKDNLRQAFEYSDCWVDDARLVVLNAIDAKERGAEILTQTTAISAERKANMWQISLQEKSGAKIVVEAKILINAAGPWADIVNQNVLRNNAPQKVRLVKGSHIIVPKFWNGPHAYVLQHADKRLIFVNPYEGNKALIGTTDTPVNQNPDNVKIDDGEIDYLLAAVNNFSKKQLSKSDILHTYAGVRPLYDDKANNPSAVTRDYVFEVEGSPPLLSVYGGKITTYRKLAEHALQRLIPFLPDMKKPWTSTAHLPGGDIANADFDKFLKQLQSNYTWLPQDLAHHYARLYGTRAQHLLHNATSTKDLGQQFAERFFEAEAIYLHVNEWAKQPDDFMFRRTKHGLTMSEKQKAAFAKFVSEKFLN